MGLKLGNVDIPLIKTTYGTGEWTTTDILNGTAPNGDITISATSISGYSFYGNTYITSVTTTDTTTVNAYAFQNCSGLTDVELQQVKTMGRNAFYNCTNIENLIVPKVETTADYTFAMIKKIVNVVMPSIKTLGVWTFYQDSLLEGLDVGESCTSLGGQALANTAISTLILRRSSGLTGVAANTFNSTVFASGGTGGTIYIPKVLYDHLGDNSNLDYKKATNWATYDGYGTITWAKIEGSIYETKYIDGTNI